MLRRISIWLITLTLIFSGGVTVSKLVSAQEGITVNQEVYNITKIDENTAKDKVKQLLEDQTADFEKVELVPQGEKKYYPRYFLQSNNGDTFRVDAVNGEILSATFTKGIKPQNKKVDLAEAKNIAEKFAKNYSSAFKLGKNMVLKEDKLIDRMSYKEYRFEWREQINNLNTPNLVVVQVDPENGAIISYHSAIFENFTATSTPSIAKDEAIKIAKGQAKFTPNKSDAKLQYGRGNQLIWIVELQTTKSIITSDNQPFELQLAKWVTIDALSGEVVNIVNSH
jgi:hypothetical protein